jgi:hypothetical protein
VLATLITFPLTFGWLAFFSDTATGPGYTIYVLGFRTVSFDALSFLLGRAVRHRSVGRVRDGWARPNGPRPPGRWTLGPGPGAAEP